MNILAYLKQEWEVIMKTPLTCLVCIGIGFAIGSWYYAGRLALLDSQVSFWKDKASSGASPAPLSVVLPSAIPPTTTPGVPSSHFTLNTAGAVFFPSAGNSSLTGILMDVQIRNSGAPSIATAWKLMVIPKNGMQAAAQFNPIPSSRKESILSNDPPVVVKASDGLAEKVANRTIPQGKNMSGKLLFYVSLPLATVEDPSTRLRLSVQDINGNEFFTE